MTVTVNEQVDVPLAFEAMQVTVEVPAGNRCGEVTASVPMRHLTVGMGLPEATGAKVTDREHPSPAALVTILPGQVIVGGTGANRQIWVARQVKAEPPTLPLA